MANPTKSISEGAGIAFWNHIAKALLVLGQAARPCRMSFFVAVIGAVIILGVVQSGEGLAALCDNLSVANLSLFSLATLWWGGTSWYLARGMLRFAFPDTKVLPASHVPLYRAVARWLPRALGIAPIACVAIAVWLCPGKPRTCSWVGTWIAVLGLMFWTFLSYRKALLEWLQAHFDREGLSPLLKSFWQDLEELYEPTLTELRELPKITRWVLAAHVGLSLVLFALYAAIPLEVARAFGAPTVLMLALSSWIACGSILTYASSWLRLPLSLILATLAFLLSGFVDNHVARPRSAIPQPHRQPVALDFTEWRRQNQAEGKPYVVVAAEGGGIRAAYWTAAILAGLQDHDPRFASRLYAISGVSGGSLGAATFDAVLTKKARSHRATAAAILGNDFLAPPLARLLYTDLVQRVLPVGFPGLDRGAALEAAWSRALAEAGVDVFGGPFEAFWSDHPQLPRLFLNATWVEKGNRVVLSYPIHSQGDDVTDGSPLASFTLGEAVHASARFPYISPALTVPGQHGPWGHLVDGGYFENSGAATAREVIEATAAPSDARIVIIHYCDGEGESAARWATELAAPPTAFFATRDARGTLAIKTLRRLFDDERRAEFCLRPEPGRPALPLGWMLSRTAQREIDRQAELAISSTGAASKVYGWLE